MEQKLWTYQSRKFDFIWGTSCRFFTCNIHLCPDYLEAATQFSLFSLWSGRPHGARITIGKTGANWLGSRQSGETETVEPRRSCAMYGTCVRVRQPIIRGGGLILTNRDPQITLCAAAGVTVDRVTWLDYWTPGTVITLLSQSYTKVVRFNSD